MEKEILSLKATNGTVIAYENKVVISRKGLGAFISQGIKGDRNFYYSELSAVEYKKPTILANGYMKFVTSGTADINAKVGIFGSSKESLQDPNTVILRAFNKDTAPLSERVYIFIMDKVEELKSKVDNGNAVSSADEILKFKKLLDEGIISREEFEIKKQQLLGL